MTISNTRRPLTLPVGLALAGALWLAALSPVFAGSAPKTIEEALRGLERTQAAGATWEGFGDGSYATFRQKSDSNLFGGRDVSYRETLVRRTEKAFFIKQPNLGSKDEVTLPESRRSPKFAAANARHQGKETIYIKNKKYDTEVYLFETKSRVAYVIDTDTYKFWLAPGIPNGVVKVYHKKRELNLLHPERGAKIRSAVETILTDTDVPILIGNATIFCACYETTGTQYGKPLTSRNCFSDIVPGGLVRQEAVRQEPAGRASTTTHQLVDYQALDAR